MSNKNLFICKIHPSQANVKSHNKRQQQQSETKYFDVFA